MKRNNVNYIYSSHPSIFSFSAQAGNLLSGLTTAIAEKSICHQLEENG
jgi:hypothetical protein